jgi:hypothetical protein
MSFPRCLLQLVGERSQIPQCSLKSKRIRSLFQWFTESDVWEFESSQPSQSVRAHVDVRDYKPAHEGDAISMQSQNTLRAIRLGQRLIEDVNHLIDFRECHGERRHEAQSIRTRRIEQQPPCERLGRQLWCISPTKIKREQ